MYTGLPVREGRTVSLSGGRLLRRPSLSLDPDTLPFLYGQTQFDPVSSDLLRQLVF